MSYRPSATSQPQPLVAGSHHKASTSNTLRSDIDMDDNHLDLDTYVSNESYPARPELPIPDSSDDLPGAFNHAARDHHGLGGVDIWRDQAVTVPADDIAMLDGGDNYQAVDSTPVWNFEPYFDEADLQYLREEGLSPTPSWVAENGDALSAIEGEIREYMEQLETVQAGVQADPYNSELQNPEIELEEDMTPTETTVNVSALAQAHRLPSSQPSSDGNPNPQPFFLPEDIWYIVWGF